MCGKELQVSLLAMATSPEHWVDVPLLMASVQLLVDVHDSLRHCGWDKLLSALRGSYYWPGMYADVVDCVRHCLVCQQDKPSMPPKEELCWTDKGGTPFVTWSIDTVGPFP